MYRWVVFGCTAAVVLYLELKPSPSLVGVPWTPRWLAAFCDRYDFFNNLLGFGGLMGAAHYAAAGWNREPGIRVLRRAIAVGFGVVVLECIQCLLPARSCDWYDVIAGWTGIGLVSLSWLRGNRPAFARGC